MLIKSSTFLPNHHNYICECGKDYTSVEFNLIEQEISNRGYCECQSKLDSFSYIKKCLKQNPLKGLMNSILYFIRAKANFTTKNVFPLRVYSFSTEELLIPKNSKIFSINYTPNCTIEGYSVFPLELHGNMPIRKQPQNKIGFYTRLLKRDCFLEGLSANDINDEILESSINLAIQIIHCKKNVDFLSHHYLLEASHHYIEYSYLKDEINYRDAIINSAISAESSVYNICKYYWKNLNLSKSKTNKKKELPYCKKLHEELDLACKKFDFPILKPSVKKALRALAQERNNILHEGITKYDIDFNIICEHLAAVVYINEFERLFFKKVAPQ